MKLPSNAVALAFGLTAICVIGAIVLAALNKTVPENLWIVAFASLTGGAGIAAPVTPTAAPPV